jgi:cytochrome c553
VAIGLIAGVPPVGAQSVAYLAGNCTSCHGPDGRSTGETPALAGLSPAWFVEQMALFRDGKRQGTIMNQLSPGYTEAQVAALADWFAKQQPSTGEAPK